MVEGNLRAVVGCLKVAAAYWKMVEVGHPMVVLWFRMLMSTVGSVLVEASPHDYFWGGGRDGEGLNYLGRLLMKLRSEFLGDDTHKAEISAGCREA